MTAATILLWKATNPINILTTIVISGTYFNFSVEKNPNWIEDVDMRVCLAIKRGWQKRIIEGGDSVVLVTGWREGPGHTNTVRILVVPEGDEPPQKLCY